MTKSELNEKLEMLNFVINDSHGAMVGNESLRAIVRINTRALDLMDALESDLSFHAKKLIPKCEALIDKAIRYVLNMETQYSTKYNRGK